MMFTILVYPSMWAFQLLDNFLILNGSVAPVEVWYPLKQYSTYL